MKISNIKAMRHYLYEHSGFSKKTVNNVIHALGYSLQGSGQVFYELSAEFEKCSEKGADHGFDGFIYYCETIAFFRANKQDIARHIEQTAADCGMDIFSMVQSFGVFRNSEKPAVSEIGKALWGSGTFPGCNYLFNVFAWYALEEVSRTWQRYLEENPAVKAALSA